MDTEVYNRPLSHHFIPAACIRHKLTIHEPRKEDTEGQRTCGLLSTRYPGTEFATNEKLLLQFGRDIDSWLALVPNAGKSRELREMHHLDDWKCTINLAHIPSPGTPPTESGNKRLTIEFRQHAGTLNPTAALSFIDVVVSLVARCSTISDNDFSAMIKPGGIFRDPTFNTSKFLIFVQCRDETLHYYDRVLNGGVNELSTYLEGQKLQAMIAEMHNYPIGKLASELVQWADRQRKPKESETEDLGQALGRGLWPLQ